MGDVSLSQIVFSRVFQNIELWKTLKKVSIALEPVARWSLLPLPIVYLLCCMIGQEQAEPGLFLPSPGTWLEEPDMTEPLLLMLRSIHLSGYVMAEPPEAPLINERFVNDHVAG